MTNAFQSWLLGLVTVACATGCYTRYGPKGITGGYEDYAAGRGVRYVSFSGNGYTSKSSVVKMWHRRCAELCGGTNSYEIVSRSGSTDTDFYVNHGQLTTVNKSFAEGYIRCASESKPVNSRTAKAGRPAKATQAAYEKVRRNPKTPDLGMTPKESKALCLTQGGVQARKSAKLAAIFSTAGEDSAPAGRGDWNFTCKVGGVAIYTGRLNAEDQGFSSVTAFYEGGDLNGMRSELEERLGPPDSVKMHDGFRLWIWKGRAGLRAYDTGVKVTLLAAAEPGPAESVEKFDDKIPEMSLEPGPAEVPDE